MKHPSNREFFAYWDNKRGDARAPDRSDIEPGAVRELLGDIFVLSYDGDAGYPFRVAGTRVCALLGRDLKDKSFSALFAPESRREIEEITAVVAEELLGAVAGITATSQDGSPAHLELLLLPFNTRAHTPISLTGLLAPFDNGYGVLGDFKLTSWRYLAHPPQRLVPRALRKLAIARGLMVYEGLR
ncbi:PAS domain-containing protein [Bradyrhizobium canariense]|nr:PAS domain-containing protein [Bradyrhizobium canariense]